MSGREIFSLFAGFASMLLSLGIARFSLTPLLPLMQGEASMTYAQAGLLASLNFFGYLSGSLFFSFYHKHRKIIFSASAILCLFSTAAMIFRETWEVSRFVAGFTGAGVYILASEFVMESLANENKRRAAYVFSGIGAGIAFSGILSFFASNSREGWTYFTILSLFLLPFVLFLKESKQTHTVSHEEKVSHKLLIILLVIAYLLDGGAYIVSATFLVSMLKAQGAASLLPWTLLGIASILSVFIWPMIAKHTGVLKLLFAAYLIQAAGILLPAFYEQGAYVAAILFGSTFMVIVSSTIMLMKHLAPQSKMVARATFAFALGQMIGPYTSGLLIDITGTFTWSMTFAGVTSILSALLLLPVLARKLNI